MFVFLLFINFILSQPNVIETTVSPLNRCITANIVTRPVGDKIAYCADFDPNCLSSSVIEVEGGTPCISDCLFHTNGAYCWVDDDRWSFCANPGAHPCPQTCNMAFENGQECAEGWNRDASMNDEACSPLTPPSGACDFDDVAQMERCCMAPPTKSPSLSPSVIPTNLPTLNPSAEDPTTSPSVPPSSSPTSNSPSLNPVTSLPSPSPTISLPTQSPTFSFPTSTPTIDCSGMDETECAENIDNGCVFSVDTSECAHKCPYVEGYGPPDDWLDISAVLNDFNETDADKCDTKCRYNDACSVYRFDATTATCVLYDTPFPQKNLIERESITTGFCHMTQPPTTSPTISLPSTSPSVKPTFGPTNAPTTTLPSRNPSQLPSQSPASSAPSGYPSVMPTSTPPSVSPTDAPTNSSAPTVLPSMDPTISKLCVFAGTEHEHCDIYCTDLCFGTPECKNYNAPVILRLRHPHAVGFFETHLDPAPKDYASLAYGFVDNGICSCETIKRTPIPGMETAECVMHEEELLTEDSKTSISEEQIWIIIAVCVFLFCCLLPLFFFLCWKKDEDEYSGHILLDDKPPAEGEVKRSPRSPKGGLRPIE